MKPKWSYPKYLDRLALANSVDQDKQLEFSSQMDLLKFYDKYTNELQSLYIHVAPFQQNSSDF